MERHLQSLLLAVIIMLLGWQGLTTFELSKSSARQDERVVHLTQQVAEINRELKDQRENYLTQSEAERRFGEHWREIASIRDRVRTLEESR